MSNDTIFVLQEVIDDLANTDKSLMAPLMKLNYFARRIKNQELLEYTLNEINGYKERERLPDYRKARGTIEVDIQAFMNSHTGIVPASMLEEPYREVLGYVYFREGISALEQLVVDRNKDVNPSPYIFAPLPMEMMPHIQPAVRRLYRSDVRLDAVGGRIKGNFYAVVEALSTVRSRLMAFTMEVGERFGYNIEISSFKQKQDQNNQTITYYMNTTITNTGDGNVVNTGNNANVTATITISKGDVAKLNEALAAQGIDEADIEEINAIVQHEQPDLENGRLGPKANGWIANTIGKALNGVGKIATGISSNLLATLIKQYYGMES